MYGTGAGRVAAVQNGSWEPLHKTCKKNNTAFVGEAVRQSPRARRPLQGVPGSAGIPPPHCWLTVLLSLCSGTYPSGSRGRMSPGSLSIFGQLFSTSPISAGAAFQDRLDLDQCQELGFWRTSQISLPSVLEGHQTSFHA